MAEKAKDQTLQKTERAMAIVEHRGSDIAKKTEIENRERERREEKTLMRRS